MKILINCPLSFALAHGGQQIQVERTLAALQASGVQVETVRWWDQNQTADLIHYFGRMPAEHIKLAQQKGIKIVMGELLTAQGSRSHSQLRLQKFISRTVERLAPRSFTAAFNWQSYQLADAVIAMTPWEKNLMNYLFGAPFEKIFIVPNGVEEVFLTAPKAERGQWLGAPPPSRPANGSWNWRRPPSMRKRRFGSSARLTRKPIPTHISFKPWLNSLRNCFAPTARRWPTAPALRKFIAPRAASCC